MRQLILLTLVTLMAGGAQAAKLKDVLESMYTPAGPSIPEITLKNGERYLSGHWEIDVFRLETYIPAENACMTRRIDFARNQAQDVINVIKIKNCSPMTR